MKIDNFLFNLLFFYKFILLLSYFLNFIFMKDKVVYIKELIEEAKLYIKNANSVFELNLISVKFFGKNGFLNKEFYKLRNYSLKERKILGSFLNKNKKNIKILFNKKQYELKNNFLKLQLKNNDLDVSLPGRNEEYGTFHPITKIIIIVENFFRNLGFSVVYGKEIEDNYHNFDALNIPNNHPSRSFKDTFFLNKNCLLRTQTSTIQIHVMKNNLPPIRIITSGKVFRRDFDKSHTPMFHQIDGFYVDRNVNFSHLKSIIFSFLNFLFKKNINIRFRPSYFPFTTPSAEVDIMNDGKWLEILGCGMVHPNILQNFKINTDIYSAFAFGIGIERLAMIIFGIKDLRVFFENDVRFLKQFSW